MLSKYALLLPKDILLLVESINTLSEKHDLEDKVIFAINTSHCLKIDEFIISEKCSYELPFRLF